MSRKPLYGMSVLSVLLGAVSYGLLSPLVKLAFDKGFTLEQVTVHQTGLAMVLLWLLALVRFKRWKNPFRGGQWVKLSIIGIGGLTLTTVFFNQALERLDASLAIVLLFQFTWITILLDSVSCKQWPGKFRLLAIVIVMIGTLLAVGILDEGLGRFDTLGVILGLLSAVAYSLFIWWTGRLEGDQDPVIRSAVMMSAGFLLVMLLYGSRAISSDAEGTLIGWGLLLGVLGQVIPTVLFNIGIPRIGSSLAALLGSLELPVAALTAWAVLGESISLMKLMGIVLILIGIGIAELPSGPRSERLASLEEK
ncbi:multidrug transporter [Paenibacillus baekrokdamisoli]|uniref:Multidrug transporter n=1 Tax=Paenibacillus baekrokdamisoli TaxID=1712516 RepID=A0A3G9JDP4_9BACL|nr:DMT family transporter [Paenibacillus baekrokdamisoli]MBB3073407.1 drug/metabolite transporter (DMT)-like permease [Paenibacillus baekrokdamisoli]BBH24041.1 multidrug transporter [Paenibacillus baekrokdamisoli]